ncbi:MAG: hypothetical protein M3243_05585, partial [Thermoproteota archaeon]|nr:hypothetical protein [Thermoproteota archaeon]
MEVEPIRECYENLRKRQVKVKWITEITKDNLSYCKTLMQYAELRHLDGIKGNFGVSDSAYIATANVNKGEPVAELIYSTAKSVLEQNKNIFDTLWNKAVLAEDRIREIEEGVVRAETKTVKDAKEILQGTIGLVRRSKRYSISSVSNGLLYAYNYAFDAFKEVLERYRKGEHAGIRWVTNIQDIEDSKFLGIIKTFMQLGMQVRHVSTVPPMSFGVSEKEMGVTVESMQGGSMNASAIFSTEPAIVEQFSSVFEELWNRGMD